MAGIKTSGKLVGLLGWSTSGLCDWLSDALPRLDQAWWNSLALPNLSYQQRERVARHGIDFVPYQFRPALKIIRSDPPRLLVADIHACPVVFGT